MELDVSKLSNIAIKAAHAAGKIIQQYMNEEVLVEQKKAGTSHASQVVTAVDRKCETIILTHLLPTCTHFYRKRPKMMVAASKKIFFGALTRWTER